MPSIRPTHIRHAALLPVLLGAVAWLCTSAVEAQATWRGIVISPEQRCSPYRPDDYRYSQSLERQIIADLGRIYGPYTGRCFMSPLQTDIEHMVARSEAHDSGLCSAPTNTRRRFASDLLNLTLASPALNRGAKKHHDASGWLPPMNQCWFAQRIVDVRRKYGLTVDRREATALERVLSSCTSTRRIDRSCAAQPAPGRTGTSAQAPNNNRSKAGAGTAEALRRWDDNGDGRITCREARRHGLAPVHRNHPAYRFMRDGDSDGTVCE